MPLRFRIGFSSCVPVTVILVATLLQPRPGQAHPALDGPIQELTRKIAENPGDAESLLRRGEFYRLGGDLARAWQDLERARKLSPKLEGLDLCRAGVLLDAGSHATALEILDREPARPGADPRVGRMRAHALEGLHRELQAAAELRRLEEETPPNPDLFVEESRLAASGASGSHIEALAALERGISRLGPLVSLEEAAAREEESLGRPGQALARRALMEEPEETSATPHNRANASVAAAPRGGAHISMTGAATRTSPAGATTATIVRGPYLQIGAPTSMVIRWRTATATDSRVLYGDGPAHLTQLHDEAPLTLEHEVKLSGLSPGTRYFYAVGSTTETLAGGDSSYAFSTAPANGAARPVRLWILGDSGLGNQGAADVRDAYVRYSRPHPADIWLMLGDNAYFSGTDAEYQAGVFDMYPGILRQLPLWPTRGNHDLLYSGPNNDYLDIFTLPTAGEAGGVASGDENYYSFDYLNIHFICLDSQDSDRSRGGAMLTWLRADLSATDREWVICFWHHPPYTKGSHDSDNDGDSGARMGEMRRNVLPILDSLGVDLVLTGHSHSYERSFLLDHHYGTSSTLTPDMKLDSGDGREAGAGAYTKQTDGKGPHQGAVYAVAGSSSQASGGPLNHPAMFTSLNVMGSMVVDINLNHLHAVFLDSQGQPRDSFDLTKRLPSGGVQPPGNRLRLAGPRPNPSTQATVLQFDLSETAPTRLEILDAQGRRIRTLVNGSVAAGPHTLTWDGRNRGGNPVEPGVYFAVLQSGGLSRTRKVTRLR